MISWDQVIQDADKLAAQILASNYRPSLIIALTRGGFVPARLLANGLNVKEMGAIGIRYEDAARTKPVIYAMPSPLDPAARVLLVEDCTESGACLAFARAVLTPLVSAIQTASLYDLPSTPNRADFCLRTLATVEPMPWEGKRA